MNARHDRGGGSIWWKNRKAKGSRNEHRSRVLLEGAHPNVCEEITRLLAEFPQQRPRWDRLACAPK